MLKIPTNWFSRGSRISSCASIFGSWQICHQVCTGLVAALATIGIAIQGMPLLFLTRWQLPLWIAGSVAGVVAVFILLVFSSEARPATTFVVAPGEARNLTPSIGQGVGSFDYAQDNQSAQIIVNGQKVEQGLNYVFRDGDQMEAVW